MTRRLDINEWIEKGALVHNDKYNYSKVNYVNSGSKVCIICPEHGEFLQQANSHLQGKGCKLCWDKKNITRPIFNRLTQSEWIDKAILIHKDRYDYSKTEYVKSTIKVCIICKKHGEFWQEANNHLAGQNCPKCCESGGEIIIREFLQSEGIEFKTQKVFKDCRYNGVLKFDFYLPDYNMLIEFDGSQHFLPHSFSSDQSEETKLKNLQETQKKDVIKTEYALNNNIRLLRIPYWKINNAQKILKNKLFNIKE
jgi:very-short-patch-repair endonuclease